MPRYKYCCVPLCKSFSVLDSEKIFVSVPYQNPERKMWLDAMRMSTQAQPVSDKTVLYVCEDHFDLEKDASNLEYVKMFKQQQGVVLKVYLKPGVLPSKFECQSSRLTTERTTDCKMLSTPKKKIIHQKELVAQLISPTDNAAPHCHDMFTDQTMEVTEDETTTITSEIGPCGRLIKEEPELDLPWEDNQLEGAGEGLSLVKGEQEGELSKVLGNHEDGTRTLYTCYHCKLSFRYFKVLKTHINKCCNKTVSRVCSNKRKETVKCSSYKKLSTVASSSDLNCHINFKPSDDHLHSCSLCNYSAETSSSLNKHIKSKHCNARQYSCSLCSYSTVRLSSLNGHIKAKHSNDRPYSCSLCSYSAVRLRSLNEHIKFKHSNDRPYSCSLCSYSGVRLRNLNEHIRFKHSNDRPYSCSWCSYSAVRLYLINRHFKSKHSKDQPKTVEQTHNS